MSHLKLVHNKKLNNVFNIEAERLYKKAIHSFVYLNNFSEAINIVDSILKIESNHSRAMLLKGEALTSLNRMEEAIKCLNKTIELNPCSSQAYSTLAGIFDKQGKREEALYACEKAIEYAQIDDYDYVTGLFDMKISILIGMGLFNYAKETLSDAKLILSKEEGDYLSDCFEEEIEQFLKTTKPALKLICS